MRRARCDVERDVVDRGDHRRGRPAAAELLAQSAHVDGGLGWLQSPPRGPTDRPELPGVERRRVLEQTPGVRTRRRIEDVRDATRRLATRPSFITMIRSARSAATPRSCVTNRMPLPSCSRRSSRRSRMRRWTVTSRALVGSSAMSSRGCNGERRGDQHALAHAAGQLVRIGRARRGLREDRRDPAVRRPFARWPSVLLAVDAERFADLPPDASSAGRASCPDPAGSGRRAPRIVCRRRRDQPWMSVPFSSIVPRRIRALAARRPSTECAVVVLPDPVSPTIATTSPGSTERLAPSTAVWTPPRGSRTPRRGRVIFSRLISRSRERG